MENKRLTDKDIYKQTLSFGWRRIYLYFKGIVLSVLVSLVFSFLDRFLAYTLNLDSHYVITWIGIGLGLFVFFFIAILPIEPMRAFHTAIITEAILHNDIPQPCIDEGMNMALKSFPVMSFLVLFIEGFKALADMVRIKDPAKRSDFRPKIKSMLMFLISSMFPYVGPCATSWSFSHPEKKTREALMEGTALFLTNLKSMIGFMIFNAVMVLIVAVLVLIGLSKLMFRLIEMSPFLQMIGREVLKDEFYFNMGFNPLEDGIVYLVSLFFMYFIWVFIRPMSTIGVIRSFYNSMKDEVKQQLFYDRDYKQCEADGTV